MIQIHYKPTFVRQFRKLSQSLQEEAKEKMALLKKDPTHSFLKTHKLKGSLNNCRSFSVNYKYRIVFQYLSKKEVVLLCIGDHDIYN